MDDEPYDDADPVTSSSDSETAQDGTRALHKGPKFMGRRRLPTTPTRSRQRQQQLQSPPPTQPKASRGPIPTLALGQVLSQKEPKISSMARQKQVRQNTASKAPRKAPVGGKTVMKAKKRRSKPGSRLITIFITIKLLLTSNSCCTSSNQAIPENNRATHSPCAIRPPHQRDHG